MIEVPDGVSSVLKEAQRWSTFAHHAHIFADLDERGLRYPIVVREDARGVLLCVGGLRIKYALARGFTHVDAITIQTLAELAPLMELQRAWNVERGLPH